MCVDFADINTACPKDSYPLSNINVLVDNTFGCELLSFMNTYSRYNQIELKNKDKMIFIRERVNYCYR